MHAYIYSFKHNSWFGEVPLIFYPYFFVIVLVRLPNWLLIWLQWRIFFIAKGLLKWSRVRGSRVCVFLFLVVGIDCCFMSKGSGEKMLIGCCCSV